MKWTWTVIAAGALCGVLAFCEAQAIAAPPSAAAAETAKNVKAVRETAKQPSKPLQTVKVTVINSRPASLIELQASVSGAAQMKKVLGALKPGKQAFALMPRGDNCQVDLHGAFDDGQTMDSTGVDICADKTFNLTD